MQRSTASSSAIPLSIIFGRRQMSPYSDEEMDHCAANQQVSSTLTRRKSSYRNTAEAQPLQTKIDVQQTSQRKGYKV